MASARFKVGCSLIRIKFNRSIEIGERGSVFAQVQVHRAPIEVCRSILRFEADKVVVVFEERFEVLLSGSNLVLEAVVIGNAQLHSDVFVVAKQRDRLAQVPFRGETVPLKIASQIFAVRTEASPVLSIRTAG